MNGYTNIPSSLKRRDITFVYIKVCLIRRLLFGYLLVEVTDNNMEGNKCFIKTTDMISQKVINEHLPLKNTPA